MKNTNSLKIATLAVVTMLGSPHAWAVDVAQCDKVFEEVRAAVERDPKKVLVIVEDAMVAYESCAREIVKAAIMGAKANSDLANQIVLAAKHVAPEMASLIAEGAGMSSPVDGAVAVETTKQGKGSEALEREDGADYELMPGDIRGLYFILPSAGGYSISSAATQTPDGSGTVAVKRVTAEAVNCPVAFRRTGTVAGPPEFLKPRIPPLRPAPTPVQLRPA